MRETLPPPASSDPSAIQSLRELNTWLKETVEAQTHRERIRVRGMAWNVHHDRNSHLRFLLRHDHHSLPVVVLSVIARRLPFHVEDGQMLVVDGKIEVYQPWGQLELVAQTVELDKKAEELEPLSVLKERAQEKGWLAEERKRPLPAEPKTIGLITGGDSRARADVIGSLEDAGIQSTVLPIRANVEGPDAAQEVMTALTQLNEHPSQIDLIVIARGGGRTTSLWGFNDWELAKAIVGSRAPVLTAIGHREDETLADLVADVRAHTPSLVGSVLARSRALRAEVEPARPIVAEPGSPVPVPAPPTVEPSRQRISAPVAIGIGFLLGALVLVIVARLLGFF